MKRYQTTAALRRALEDRLAALATAESEDVQQLRRRVAFDRFLCRLFQSADAPWLLKGGYAMELRIKAARTTRDIDLALRPLRDTKQGWDDDAVLAVLQEAAQGDLQDGFSFLVGRPTMDLDAAPYGGARFPVEAQMADRRFAQFHIDVSSGDVLREPFEQLECRDWLGFAGIPAARVPAISQEEQFAEKFHAYTLPREGRSNSRVKDLVDLVLLMRTGKLDTARLRSAINDTFRRRKTHPVPETVQSPPATWELVFAELAKECGLSPALQEHFTSITVFVFQVLG